MNVTAPCGDFIGELVRLSDEEDEELATEELSVSEGEEDEEPLVSSEDILDRSYDIGQ